MLGSLVKVNNRKKKKKEGNISLVLGFYNRE